MLGDKIQKQFDLPRRQNISTSNPLLLGKKPRRGTRDLLECSPKKYASIQCSNCFNRIKGGEKMKMSYIVCKNCYSVAPPPYNISVDDETMFERMLSEIRLRRIACPHCGGHKWIRKVASKL
jgi:DNA-directed RNA polymerase subunit RPC12/RpoP